MTDEQFTDHVPGQHHLGPTVDRFDEAVDEELERFRGNPVLDSVFTTASHVGDFSLIWHTINLLLGVRGRNPRRVVMFTLLIGVESLVVNQGVKRLFRRTRPTTTGDGRLTVRRPTTSSFPSGHASSAMFAAALLVSRTRQPVTALIWAAAAIVATSRAYVRIHHASDVVAGVVTGGVLVALARRLIRRLGLDHLL
jgi:undecaprenyl-diphosphatase